MVEGVVCRCVWMYDVVGLSWAEISVRENYARLLNGSQTSGEWGAARSTPYHVQTLRQK